MPTEKLLTFLDPARPWEQQPGERDSSYAAFLQYRDLPQRDRSLATVAQLLGITRQAAGNLSSRWSWVVRIHAWDKERQAMRDAADMAVERAMLEEHAKAAKALQLVALRHLSPPAVNDRGRSLSEVEQRHWRPDSRALVASATALDKAIHHQRLATGLPTNVTQQDVTLKQIVNEALDTQRLLRAVIEEHLCADCRTKIGGELARIRQHHEALAGKVS